MLKLANNQALGASEAARLLGIPRALVVHRMDIGDLPCRHSGGARLATLQDVLALKARIDAQRAALQALAADAEDLTQRSGA
jgi:hypothetical protein